MKVNESSLYLKILRMNSINKIYSTFLCQLYSFTETCRLLPKSFSKYSTYFTMKVTIIKMMMKLLLTTIDQSTPSFPSSLSATFLGKFLTYMPFTITCNLICHLCFLLQKPKFVPNFLPIMYYFLAMGYRHLVVGMAKCVLISHVLGFSTLNLKDLIILRYKGTLETLIKFICCAHSFNELVNFPFETIGSIISNHSTSEVMVLVDLKVHNKDCLQSTKTDPKEAARSFAVSNNLTHIIHKPNIIQKPIFSPCS